MRSDMNSRFINFLKFLIGWPLSLAAIFFIGRLVILEWGKIAPFIKFPNLSLLIPGTLLLCIYFFFRAYVWKRLLEEKGHPIPFKEASYLWGISEIKRYAPGFVWAFIGKTLSFGEKGVDRKTVANLILIEISFFMLGTIIVSLLAINFVSSNLFSINDTFKLLIYLLVSITSIVFVFNKSIFEKIRLPRFLSLVNHALPKSNPSVNFNLLAISVFSHFIFGLGTYLTIISIVYLPLNLSLSLIGLFTLSLLVGYLSIIVPMGLGVREGFITFALSKIIAVEIAGFASIFARIVFTISELLFLAILIAWKKLENKFTNKLEKIINEYLHEIILGISALIYSVYFTIFSFLRYDNFFTGRFDLGNMDQTVWNTLNGRVFIFSNPDNTNIVSRLSFHADFLLVLLAPFYLIWSDPRMILIIQTIILATGAIFVFLVSKKIVKNKTLSLIMALSYLLNPSVQFSNLYDFHPVTLATTFLLAAFYFVLKKRYYWFLLFLFLSVISKEQIWLISAVFGAYIFFVNKQKALGTAIFGLSIGAFYTLVSYIIPHFHQGQHFALSNYSDFGDSPAGIIKNIIFSPKHVVSTLLSNSIFDYLVKLFAPVGFLSLFYIPYLLFALPDLTANLLGNNVVFRQIYYQYTATITPFAYISAIYAIKTIIEKFGNRSTGFLICFLLISAILSAYFIGPLPFSKYPNTSVFTQQLAYRKEVDQVLKTIPESAKVSASNNLGSHLAQREHLYNFPLGIDQADYLALLLNDGFAQPSLDAQKQIAGELKNNPKFKLIYEKQDFLLFKRMKY